jgi:hypothetical protein
MKIVLRRDSWRFWFLYFFIHFSFLLIVLFVFRWLWVLMHGRDFIFDIAETAFESFCYSVLLTLSKYIRYRISKKQYEKNPVDRRKNNMFRE